MSKDRKADKPEWGESNPRWPNPLGHVIKVIEDGVRLHPPPGQGRRSHRVMKPRKLLMQAFCKLLVRSSVLVSAIPKQLLFPVLATSVVLSTGCWTTDNGPSRQTTAQAITAVAERIFPLTKDGDYEECPPLSSDPDYSQCPVTPRLLDRLKQSPDGSGAGSAAPFCRCQNTSPDRSITAEVTPGGGIAHVRLFEGRSHIDLVMRLQDGRLLVDDTRCTGRGESTSIYSRQLADCGGGVE